MTPKTEKPSPLQILNTAFYIRRKDVLHLTQFSNATLYRRMAEGSFPRPLRSLGVRTVCWKCSDVREWIDSQAE